MTRVALTAASLGFLGAFVTFSITYAQEQTGAASNATASTSTPTPLTADKLKILVAPVALYPDELVAVISQASLYPLQIVEADRYLEQYAKNKSLKPKASWDGSVISLLNYPNVVKKMSQNLDWTQQFGNAITYQQKDVLVTIQQLRHEAVAKDIIKSDDKIKVTEENDKVAIQSASAEKVHVPRYEPEMLYVADHPPKPISYYPEPYPSYWYPTATFFAAAVTGAAWAAAVDWNNWGVWGGRWGNDIDIDCNHCFNNRNFNGKVNFKDIDWRNVDRSKIGINRDQFAKFSQANIRNSLERNDANDLRNRTANIRNERQSPSAGSVGNVRKNTLEGLKNQPGQVRANAKTAVNANRVSGKAKSTSKANNRPKKASGGGNTRHAKVQKTASNRGAHAMRAVTHGRGAMTAHRPQHHMAGPRPRGGGNFHAGGHGGRRRR